MFTFTAEFADEEKVINLPEKWDEVTFEQYADLVHKDDGDWFTRLNVFTGIDVQDLKSLPLHAIDLFVSVLKFLANSDELKQANVAPDGYEKFNYANIPYLQHEKVMAELKRVNESGLTTLHAAPMLVEVCTKNEFGFVNIRNKPITEVIGIANFFLSRSMLF